MGNETLDVLPPLLLWLRGIIPSTIEQATSTIPIPHLRDDVATVKKQASQLIVHKGTCVKKTVL